METLQADFKIVPVGVAETGAWKYAFIYDLVHRRYPELPEQARAIRQADARARLAELYFRSVGAAQDKDLAKLFGWPKSDLAATLDDAGRRRRGLRGRAVGRDEGRLVRAARIVVIAICSPRRNEETKFIISSSLRSFVVNQ